MMPTQTGKQESAGIPPAGAGEEMGLISLLQRREDKSCERLRGIKSLVGGKDINIYHVVQHARRHGSCFMPHSVQRALCLQDHNLSAANPKSKKI